MIRNRYSGEPDDIKNNKCSECGMRITDIKKQEALPSAK
jgi:hypothetical protein